MAYDNEEYVEPEYVEPEPEYQDETQPEPPPPEEEAIPTDASLPTEAYDESIPEDPAAEEGYGPEDWVRQLLDETRQQFGIGGEEQHAIPDEEQPAEARAEVPADETQIPENAQETKGAIPEGGFGSDRAVKEIGLPESWKPQGEGEPAPPLAPLSDNPPPANVGIKNTMGPGPGEQAPPGEAFPQNQPGVVQQMMRYLFGAGADPSHEQRVEQVKANNPGMPENDARYEALRQAAQEGQGPGALQSEREKYTSIRGLAAAAAGNGDMDKATQLFNEAHKHVPNGQNVTAVNDGNGVTLHIPAPAGGSGGTGTPESMAERSVRLNDAQFNELLHKPVGEFDHLIERGLYQNASDLARTPGLPLDRIGQQGAPGYTPPTPASEQPLRPGEKLTTPSQYPSNVAPRGQMPREGQLTPQEYEAQFNARGIQSGKIQPPEPQRELTQDQIRDQQDRMFRERREGQEKAGTDARAAQEKSYTDRAKTAFPDDPAKQQRYSDMLRQRDQQQAARAEDQRLRQAAIDRPRAVSQPRQSAAPREEAAPRQSSLRPRGGGGGHGRRRRRH